MFLVLIWQMVLITSCEDISFQFLLSACSTLNYPSPWNVFPRGVTKCNHWIAVWARLEHRSVCNKTHRQSSPQKSWTEKQLQNCLVCVAETVTIKLRTPVKWSLLIVSGTQQLWQTKIIRTTTCILQGEAHVLAGRGGQDRGGQGWGRQGRRGQGKGAGGDTLRDARQEQGPGDSRLFLKVRLCSFWSLDAYIFFDWGWGCFS